jgi:probable DNA metabolism protein
LPERREAIVLAARHGRGEPLRATHFRQSWSPKKQRFSTLRYSGFVTARVEGHLERLHAFVRFHKKQTDDGELYVAWFEPDYFILKRATPFFTKRFANMRWIIATPVGTATWDMKALTFGPPRPKLDNLQDDVLDGLWRTYFTAPFSIPRV